LSKEEIKNRKQREKRGLLAIFVSGLILYIDCKYDISGSVGQFLSFLFLVSSFLDTH